MVIRGADVGNRRKFVELHEGSRPFCKTPQVVPTNYPPLEPAAQANELNR
jgi:hypothetical protein